MARKPRTRTAPKTDAGEVRIKLLQPDLPEGPVEALVRVSNTRANELIGARHARLANRDDFRFAQ